MKRWKELKEEEVRIKLKRVKSKEKFKNPKSEDKLLKLTDIKSWKLKEQIRLETEVVLCCKIWILYFLYIFFFLSFKKEKRKEKKNKS